MFRFRKQDIPLLAQVLGVPEKITCPHRSVCSGMEDFCMVLKWVAYPCRYSDMIQCFDRPVPEDYSINITSLLTLLLSKQLHNISGCSKLVTPNPKLMLIFKLLQAFQQFSYIYKVLFSPVFK